jgi:site-specific DNA recombinase
LRFSQEKRCTARFIPAQQLDDLVWTDLCNVLTHPDAIAHALQRAHGGHWLPQELRARREMHRKAEQHITRQKERLLSAYLIEVIDLAEFERKRAELDRKQAALIIEKAQLEATIEERIELSSVAFSIEAFCANIQPRC